MLSQSIHHQSVRNLIVVVTSAILIDCSSSNNNPGNSETGGSTATSASGGSSASGGKTTTGGAKSSGGTTATAGATSASGGAQQGASGGATSAGGATGLSLGGTSSQGGSSAAGGATSSGGLTATGGVVGVGGTTSATGGAPGDDAGDVEDGSERVTFTMVYTDIISARCTGCHTPSGPGVTVGNLDMSTKSLAYANLVGSAGMGITAAGSMCGTSGLLRIAPGDHEMSLLWQKVDAKLTGSTAPCGNPMPAGSTNAPLTSAQVDEIEDWIDSGAADN